MSPTTVQLPEKLKLRAERAAQNQGISLEQFICQSLKAALAEMAENDPLFADQAVFRGPGSSDLAAEHDEYLYGEQS